MEDDNSSIDSQDTFLPPPGVDDDDVPNDFGDTAPQALSKNDSTSQSYPFEGVPLLGFVEEEYESDRSDNDPQDDFEDADLKASSLDSGMDSEMEVDSNGAEPETNLPSTTVQSVSREADLVALLFSDGMMGGSDNKKEHDASMLDFSDRSKPQPLPGVDDLPIDDDLLGYSHEKENHASKAYEVDAGHLSLPYQLTSSDPGFADFDFELSGSRAQTPENENESGAKSSYSNDEITKRKDAVDKMNTAVDDKDWDDFSEEDLIDRLKKPIMPEDLSTDG